FPYTTLFRSTYSRSQELILSQTVLPDDHSEREPPDPIPNSDVKPLSADGSVGPPHVRVAHRQASIPKPQRNPPGLFSLRRKKSKAPTPRGGADLLVCPQSRRDCSSPERRGRQRTTSCRARARGADTRVRPYSLALLGSPGCDASAGRGCSPRLSRDSPSNSSCDQAYLGAQVKTLQVGFHDALGKRAAFTVVDPHIHDHRPPLGCQV